jgi:hypothetical protein
VSGQAHTGTRLCGRAAACTPGIILVGRRFGTARPTRAVPPPSAAAISCAVGKRSSTVSSIARSTAASAAGEMRLFSARGGWKTLRLAMRCVAVGGAWPVSAWYSVAPRP